MVHPSLLFVLLMLHTTTPTIYYVTPEYDDTNIDDNKATNILNYYLNHTDEYFTSDSQLCFLPGEYILNTDLILKNINNFTLTGINSTTIHCTSHVSVMIVNVTDFKFENMNLINCGRSQAKVLYFDFTQMIELMIDNHVNNEYNTTILLYNCTSVVIKNINILVDKYSTGLLAVNIMNTIEMTNVKVQINCNSTPSSYAQPLGCGILFYYNDRNGTYDTFANVTFCSFHYKIHNSCLHYQLYAMKFLLYQNKYNVSITIKDTLLSNLINTTALYCHMAACEFSATNKLIILNSIIRDNIGNSQLKMFDVMLHRSQCTYDSPFIGYTQKVQNLIIFKNCSFTNNTNMEAMIYITPKSSARIIGYFLIQQTKFTNNNATHFMKVKSVTEVSPWLLTTNISIRQLNASLNEHQDGDSLISITNGYISFKGSVINENHYYESILQLHLSVAVCSGYNELNGNHARHILKGKLGSYFIAKNNAILNMSENTVYMVAKQIRTFADDAKPICPLQFWNSQSFYNNLAALNIKVLMLNNVHMMSRDLQGEDLLFKNCAWLAGFAFYKISAKIVYQRILVIQNIIINKTTERVIPLSVCPCSTSNNMSCYSPNLGSLFPGQALQINLIVRKQNKIPGNHSTTLVAANTLDDDYTIVDSYQLSQTHLNSGCNNYNYTIWPSHKHITECLLFIGLIEAPEMFYVQIKSCPKGFTLQEHKRSCNCDPALSNIITSCNLNDQTVFRPAKSWISADTVNGSHNYHVTQLCPFDYCLLHSSHLDLDTPDVQCQFRRSGFLCGHCQQGLSTVFGSSQCRHCSNIQVLIVLPIAIAGIAIVMMLFLFDITVTNGTINSFIFYVNMISINYSMFCHEKHSVYCTLLHLLNLDLGIETCFYNGMDDYAKMWLQLMFPSYLLMIAFALIIGSRYSNTIQRLTSRRALQVLATLFLLSYTKMLLTVCKTLFFYSVITHLPNKHTTLAWSIDASVPVFGIKFSILFVVCLIIFLTLLLFNILLLFPWTLLRFKYINTFKPLFDAYFGPYKDKYTFWTGFQLLMRAIFIGVSSLDKSIGMISEVIVLGILLCIQGIVHPFRSRFKNVQESLVLLDLLIVYIIASLIKHSLNLLLIKLLISMLLAYFIIYITYHCIMLMCGNVFKQRYKKILKWFKKTNRRSPASVEMIGYHCEIPEIKINYKEFQEPLIALSK